MNDAASARAATIYYYNSSNLERAEETAMLSTSRDTTTDSNSSTDLGNVTVTLTITLSANWLQQFMTELIANAEDPNPPSPIGGSGPISGPSSDPKIDIVFSLAQELPDNS